MKKKTEIKAEAKDIHIHQTNMSSSLLSSFLPFSSSPPQSFLWLSDLLFHSVLFFCCTALFCSPLLCYYLLWYVLFYFVLHHSFLVCYLILCYAMFCTILFITSLGSKPSPELDPELILEVDDRTIPPPPPPLCFSLPTPTPRVLDPKSDPSPVRSFTLFPTLIGVLDGAEDAGRWVGPLLPKNRKKKEKREAK